MNVLRNFICVPVLACCFVASSLAAEPSVVKETASKPDSATLARGKYLVTLGGCHDCHTPKLMTEKGPALDTKRLLSGFPSSEKVPAVPAGIIGPNSWGGLFTNDLTGWAGPWGISFASNLTPDKETGIGAWTEKTFITTLRTGKTPGGRPILPPMPWEGIQQASDKDLKAMFAYLMSLPPVRNMVPAPVPPK
jgi:mono/diheme cytochrome c family protein